MTKIAIRGRTSAVHSLLPEHSEQLLDVGCGPVTLAYPHAGKASRVTCVDWNLRLAGPLPPNVNCIDADFTSLDLLPSSYDAIIAVDVFEHILLESESAFVDKCVSALKPGGVLVVSVPHQGTFAFLDPCQVKPTLCRLLARLGLYKSVHNGFCDIRKGHKHYRLQELSVKFFPLQVSESVYFGYFFDPLLNWAIALSRVSGRFAFSWLQRARDKELTRDYGQRSFNIAVSFIKPRATESESAFTSPVPNAFTLSYS
jgi:2-polyprenyl-3-methyl-5-hydroxy-6-metoxy-1,4-benzoquinol methylase